MLYDLSHTITPDIPFYPGDPAPHIEGNHGAPPWRVSALHLGSHSGTHIDAPSHYIAHAPGIGSYAPDRFIRVGQVVDARGSADNQPISATVLDSYDITPGSVVVLRTGWEAHWRSDRYFRHPYLSDALAAALVARGVSLLGIDALNVDSTPDGTETVHARLLGADILIVENLRGLDALEAGRPYVFAFAPLAVGDIDGAPVRGLAWDVDHPFMLR